MIRSSKFLVFFNTFNLAESFTPSQEKYSCQKVVLFVCPPFIASFAIVPPHPHCSRVSPFPLMLFIQRVESRYDVSRPAKASYRKAAA
jgi:hypothetical protein